MQANLKAKPIFQNTHESLRNLTHFHAALIVMQKRDPVGYTILLNRPVIWTVSESLPTAGTDGNFTYINPMFVNDLSVPVFAFVLSHETDHIILAHQQRGLLYQERGFVCYDGSNRVAYDADLYNRACDYVINANKKSQGFEIWESALMDSRFTREHTAEQVYLELYREQQAQQGQQGQQGQQNGQQTGQQGQSANGQSNGSETAQNGQQNQNGGPGPNADTNPQPQTGAQGQQGQQNGQQTGQQGQSANGQSNGSETAQNGQQGQSQSGQPQQGQQGQQSNATPKPSQHGGTDHFSPNYDTGTGSLENAVQGDLAETQILIDDAIDMGERAIQAGDCPAGAISPQIAVAGKIHSVAGKGDITLWTDALNEFINRNGTGGEIDYSRIRARDYALFGVITPTEKGSIESMAITIDVSGSVNRHMIKRFLEEIGTIIDTYKPIEGCQVLFCNTQVIGTHTVATSYDLEDLPVPNCGGTKMGAAVQWLDDHGYYPTVHMIFTDGQLPHGEYRQLAKHDNLLVVLDRPPSASLADRIVRSGCNVVVADDHALTV